MDRSLQGGAAGGLVQGRLVLLAGCVLAAACGASDPEYLHDTARGVRGHAVSGGAGASAGAGADAGAVSPPARCADLGSPCSTDGDCCAGECSGTCGATKTICAGGGEPCWTGADCCTGLCDPDMAACY